jgi:hypothetical protein
MPSCIDSRKGGNARQKVPDDAYAGEYAESLCVAYQCKVLRCLGPDVFYIYRMERRLESKWWESSGAGWDIL